jgi:hypothetical protein
MSDPKYTTKEFTEPRLLSQRDLTNAAMAEAATRAETEAEFVASAEAADLAKRPPDAEHAKAAERVLKYFRRKSIHDIFDELSRSVTTPMSEGLQNALFSDLKIKYNTFQDLFINLLFDNVQRMRDIQSELNDRLINVRKMYSKRTDLNDEDLLKYVIIMMLLKKEKELLMGEALSMSDSDIAGLKRQIGDKPCEGTQCNVSGGYQSKRKPKTFKKQKKSTTAKKQKKNRKSKTSKKQKKNRKSKTAKR